MKTAKSQLQDFAKHIMQQQIEPAMRVSVVRIANSVITESPVDKGLFRNGWNTSINSISYDESRDEDRSGSGSIGELKATTLSWSIGDSLFLNNPSKYGARLEFDGWSEQAPNGFLRVNTAKWDKVVQEEVSRRKK